MRTATNDSLEVQLNENQLQTVVNFSESRFSAIVKQAIVEIMGTRTEVSPSAERKTLHSIRELADFIGCSIVTAQKYKNEGRIPYRQVGRKVQFDTEEVLKAMDKTVKKSRK